MRKCDRDSAIQEARTRGSISVILMLFLIMFVSCILGGMVLLGRWHRIVNIQIRLDECAGRTALEMRKLLNFIEAQNSRIKIYRAAVVSSVAFPAAIPYLKKILQIEAVVRKAYITSWKINKATSSVIGACGRVSDRVLRFPDLPWSEIPPDWIGAKPLEWATPSVRREETELRILIFRHPRYGGAKVRVHEQTNDWIAEWAGIR